MIQLAPLTVRPEDQHCAQQDHPQRHPRIPVRRQPARRQQRNEQHQQQAHENEPGLFDVEALRARPSYQHFKVGCGRVNEGDADTAQH
ncbi:MAG: hypothetical protein R3E76_00210 [Planctomycetota bacterium]